MLIDEAMEELRAMYPHGSFSILWTHPHGFHANVHAGGICYTSQLSNRALSSAHFLDAINQVPAPEDAAKKRLERAKAELAAAEAAMTGSAA